MKIYPRKTKIIIDYLIVYFIALVVFYFIPGPPYWPPRTAHYIIFTIWTLATIGYLTYAITHNYYEISKTRIIHYRGRKRLVYDFNSILYIDVEWSKKHKRMLFYTALGDERYLTLDKDGVLLTKTLDKCKNLITREEYKERFPKSKI